MIYTDGRIVIADSDRELQMFMKKIGSQDLPCNTASYFSYYRIAKEHLEQVVVSGALVFNTEQLHAKTRELLTKHYTGKMPSGNVSKRR